MTFANPFNSKDEELSVFIGQLEGCYALVDPASVVPMAYTVTKILVERGYGNGVYLLMLDLTKQDAPKESKIIGGLLAFKSRSDWKLLVDWNMKFGQAALGNLDYPAILYAGGWRMADGRTQVPVTEMFLGWALGI